MTRTKHELPTPPKGWEWKEDKPMPDEYMTAKDLEPIDDPIMKFFAYIHLPLPLAVVSKLFADLAAVIYADIPRSAERSVALRKLLEAKDAAVRAQMEGEAMVKAREGEQ